MTLEEYRGLLSWSQAELARQAGLNNQTVSYAERGEVISSKTSYLQRAQQSIRPTDTSKRHRWTKCAFNEEQITKPSSLCAFAVRMLLSRFDRYDNHALDQWRLTPHF